MFVGEVIEFTDSKGASIRFDGSPFGLVSVEGLGGVEADIQQQRVPFSDGTSLVDVLLEPRYVPIEFIIRGKDYAEVSDNRRRLSEVLNPKNGLGTLKYISEEFEREIKAVAESVPVYADMESRGERWQRGLVTFICPNPYWQSETIEGDPAFEGAFEFPFEGEFELGIQRDERVIVNDSDAELPVRVVFYGPADRPTIKNLTTGEFIRINKRLEENEKLIVDTADDEKSVYFENENGVSINVFHWLDLGSTFFKLETGENEISCMCTTSDLIKDFEIYYKKLYVAV